MKMRAKLAVKFRTTCEVKIHLRCSENEEICFMKNNVGIWVVRVILIALIIFWMTVIFGFSADDGDESQSLSDRITIEVVQIIEPDYESLDVQTQQALFDKVSFYVRKTGHFGEYGILGLLIAGLLLTFEKIRALKKSELKMVLIAAGICMIYAATDEIHQGFVDGRSPKVMDVCIDTAGGFAGAGFLMIIWFLSSRKRRKDELMGK